MKRKQFKKMKRGDIVANNATGTSYVLESKWDDGKTVYWIGIRTVLVTNSDEWDLVKL